jgi:hypothetical protein
MIYNAVHESSMIQSSTYDTNTLELSVTFNNGSVYNYQGVIESDYNEFVTGESTGAAFNTHIRKYTGNKIITEVNGDNLKGDSELLLG